MARYCGAVCRLCRREGEKLFLKGERCFTAKCAFERRENPPGQHGAARQSFSNYKIQLRAKQKAKRVYGVMERKFRLYFDEAAKKKGVTGTDLLVSLERRLDNVVHRLGIGLSRPHSRQIVRHGHILVNGKPVDLPGYPLSAGDIIEVKEGMKGNVAIQGGIKLSEGRTVPEWLSLDKNNVKGVVNYLPTRDQIPATFREQLIVELYSR